MIFRKRQPEDSLKNYRGEMKRQDASLFPSYSCLHIPYRVICRQRYHKSGRMHRREFCKEHHNIASCEANALSAVRFHREFCDNVLVPISQTEKIHLTPKETLRIQYILEHDII